MTFTSPVIPKNIWTLCFRDRATMTKLYYEDRTPEEGARINGLTDYINLTVYIDKELDGFLLIKTIRHELTHIYLWETGQQDRIFNEEEMCDFISVAAPLINDTANKLMIRLKEGLYKKGE